MPRKRHLPVEIDAFMRRHWQREPLLVRGAFPRFRDPLSPKEVLALAGRDEAQSRLVVRRGRRWTVEHGPIPAARFKQLPRREWTVLVQDTNHFSRRADELLGRFDFIPHARIDDVMVSYAVPGGSVGPHVDSYDVFLLQGHGRRRWSISAQRDHEFVPGLPLKVLSRFVPEREWVLEAGDMLYLPPGIAHHGVAESECLTWSIGFRAPTDAEIVAGFLDHLRDALEPAGQYRDPGAPPARHPGELPAPMIEHAARALAAIRWTGPQVRDFVGRFATEPKAHVFFDPPARPLGRADFVKAARRRGLTLDPRSRLVFSGTIFFINGAPAALPPAARPVARRLADRRRLPGPLDAPAAFWEAAHAWYRQGFVVLEGETT
ncbi:MAG TPA: cupin domain-containing protein [Usitatibacter sp.]|jgi:50S ribosomal protein L16 3-hydroxylase|nr:cupin domain-containing protein [Usitatibacter sp.]